MKDKRNGHFPNSLKLTPEAKQKILAIANCGALTPLTSKQLRLFADNGFTPLGGGTRFTKFIIEKFNKN